MLTHAFVIAALVHSAAFTPSDALAVAPYSHRHGRFPSALSYSNGEDDGETHVSPLPIPHALHWRIRGRERQPQHRQEAAAPPMAKKSTEEEASTRPSRHIPRRAMPHVKNPSHAEAATRAGYIMRGTRGTQMSSRAARNNDDEREQRGQRQRRQTDDGGPRVRPLRSIRRIVHRSTTRRDEPLQSLQGLQQRQRDRPNNRIRIEGPNNSLDVHVRNRPNNERSRLSLSNNPRLDEFLDTPEQLLSPDREGPRMGARRVTFKATREASKSIMSKHLASLTEYMTQPVSQYSLLSFHDAETDQANSNGNNENNPQRPRSRRWLVRRLNTEEAHRYISDSAASPQDENEVMEESNLFRLAVPLLPLIGWDLTPVIDLEVIPPKNDNELTERPLNNSGGASEPRHGMPNSPGESGDPESAPPSAGWAPLRGIRERINHPLGDDTSVETTADSSPPVVKIRSLRVSLLSTQEEVKEVMTNGNSGGRQRPTTTTSHGGGNNNNMQKEALEMVGKVEEWLKPQITFEAELSWDDAVASAGGGGAAAEGGDSLPSTVTVRSTAVTSLTIPEIPSDIIRKTVPSAFLVKRLGATLTSRALAICLPRFLRQLEKDYNRWSGLGLGAEIVESDDSVIS